MNHQKACCIWDFNVLDKYNFEMKLLVMVTWQAAPASSVVSFLNCWVVRWYFTSFCYLSLPSVWNDNVYTVTCIVLVLGSSTLIKLAIHGLLILYLNIISAHKYTIIAWSTALSTVHSAHCW